MKAHLLLNKKERERGKGIQIDGGIRGKTERERERERGGGKSQEDLSMRLV